LRLTDAALCNAVARAEKGLIDADLGGGVIKQRVARLGAGKSGGCRTLILYRSGERAVFAFGFAKSAMDNIGALAELTLRFSDSEITELIEVGKLVEVKCDD
jgi:hypothetical protein